MIVTRSVFLLIFPRQLSVFHHARTLKDHFPRISASSSGASEQNAVSFGPNTYGLQQNLNLFLATLTTVGRMRYKCHNFRWFKGEHLSCVLVISSGDNPVQLSPPPNTGCAVGHTRRIRTHPQPWQLPFSETPESNLTG